MECALVALPGVEDLIEFETRVNYVVPKYTDTVICAYNLSKFGASVVMDALRTHPVGSRERAHAELMPMGAGERP